MKPLTFAATVCCALLLAACGHQSAQQQPSPPPAQTAFDARSIPAGHVGDLTRYGYELIMQTRTYMRPYVTANMDCAACHTQGGTKPRGGNLVGIAAQFPQWNTRAKRVISLQDRIAECFLYSMNGRPPAYNSREMEAIVAYVTYLSRGAKLGSKPDPATRIAHFQSPLAPDPKHGSQLYTQKCSMCHAANGAGGGGYPPLWGPTSFNNGAGMHRLWTMAGFVRYNMPKNAPGTLSDQEAYDVAAYVLSHSRPKFDKTRAVTFPPQDAGYF